MAQILKHPCDLPRAGTSIPKPGGDKFMMRRRDFLASAAATCLGPGLAGAQGAWPQRPISLVVPFSAGGSADLVARMFAQHFQRSTACPWSSKTRVAREEASVQRSS